MNSTIRNMNAKAYLCDCENCQYGSTELHCKYFDWNSPGDEPLEANLNPCPPDVAIFDHLVEGGCDV